jgi:hypothetical protein
MTEIKEENEENVKHIRFQKNKIKLLAEKYSMIQPI